MNINYDPDFKRQFEALPTQKLKNKVLQKIQFLANNPHHKSLNFKKFSKSGKINIWQFRVDIKWRIWGIRDRNDITLYYIFHK